MWKYSDLKIEFVGFLFPLLLFFYGIFTLSNSPYLFLDLNLTQNKVYLTQHNNAELVAVGSLDVRPTDFFADMDRVESRDDFFHYVRFHVYVSEYIKRNSIIDLKVVNQDRAVTLHLMPSGFPLTRLWDESSLFGAAFFCLVIAFVLMRKHTGDIRVRVFILLLYATSTIFISFGIWNLKSISLDTVSTFLIFLSNVVAFIYFPLLFLHFFLIFPVKRAFALTHRFYYVYYLVFPFVLSMLYYSRMVYSLLSLLYVMALLGGMGIMFYSYRHATPVQKAQLKWILWGTMLFTLIMLFSYVLPLLGVVSELYSYQVPAVAFGLIPVTIAFAISQYKLMDIDELIDNTLIYTMTFGVLFLSDFGIVYLIHHIISDRLSETAVTLIALWIAIFLYIPVRRLISYLIERLLKRGRYNSQEIALSLAKSMIPIQTTEAMVQLAEQSLSGTLHPKFIKFYLIDSKGNTTSASQLDFESLPSILAPMHVFRLPVQALPQAYSSGVVAPVIGQKRMLGYMLLGEKESQQLYSERDMQLIETVVAQTAIGIESIRAKDRAREDKEKMIREIHDGVGGIAANISIISQMAQESDSNEYVVKSVQTISELSKDAVFEIRGILQSLDISSASSQELVETLRRFAKTMLEPHEITFELTVDLTSAHHVPSAVVTLNIFRVYREALANIVKYANATEVKSSIEITQEYLLLMIQDNGVGLQSVREGRGITHMVKRSEEMGASFTITGNQGVSIEMKIPLYKDEVK